MVYTEGVVHRNGPAMNGEWRFPSTNFDRLRAVRGLVLDLLRSYGDPAADFDACAVVLSELMSNAALHAPAGSVRVTLDWSEGTPVVAVTDPGRGFTPNIELPHASREGGRGLFLVKHLASTPQIAVHESGCTVSVRLPVQRAPFRVGPRC